MGKRAALVPGFVAQNFKQLVRRYRRHLRRQGEEPTPRPIDLHNEWLADRAEKRGYEKVLHPTKGYRCRHLSV